MPDVVFNGTAGRIEGRYHQVGLPNAPIAIVLHPHPLHGGTMHNKVAYALYRCFVERGFNVLRFNFRGVGRSEGKFDQGEGELNDTASALDWLQACNPNPAACWVAGFSFGAWIGMQLLMRRPEITGFISISPPAGMNDFNFLAPCPVSGLIVQGAADTVVAPAAVDNLVTKLKTQRGLEIGYEVVPQADHFFTNHLPELAKLVLQYLDYRMGHNSFKKAG